MNRSTRHQAGDTIVEVIIAVVVVATLLTGAFIVTNRSTNAVRDSQEHAQGLQALQGQVELLRAASAVSGNITAALVAHPKFCLDAQLKAYAAGSASCENAKTPAFNYSLSIACSSVSAGCPAGAGITTTFDLVATWPKLNGGTDTVFLSYKTAVEP